jgi:hypothetical protein
LDTVDEVLQRPAAKPLSRKARRREQHRQRQARCRQRAAAGVVLVEVALTQVETEKLRAYRFLSESELEDKRAIAEALHALIYRLA